MKCAICNARKGKRGCKVTSNQLICSSCCASTRSPDCEGCGYYEASLAYSREKEARRNPFITEIIPDADERCDEALALVDQGQVDQGRALLEALRLQYPNYHMVIYGIGVCHALKKETSEAIACFERAIEIFPPFAEAHYNLGASYRERANVARAVKAFQAAIAADGANGEIGRLARERLDELETIMQDTGISLSTYMGNQRIFERAFEALDAGRFEDAIELFAQVLKTQKDHVQCHGNMGLAYARLGKKQKALECLDRALALDPEYEPALVNRVSVLRMQEGEAPPATGQHELSYYSEFKLRGKSLIQQLADEVKGNRK